MPKPHRTEFVIYPTNALLAVAEHLRSVGSHQPVTLTGTLAPGSLTEAMVELAEAAVRWGESNSWVTGEWDAFYAALARVKSLQQ